MPPNRRLDDDELDLLREELDRSRRRQEENQETRNRQLVDEFARSFPRVAREVSRNVRNMPIQGALSDVDEALRRVFDQHASTEEVEIDFSETGVSPKFNLIRDKLWVAKNGDIYEIEKMSDNHLIKAYKMFRNWRGDPVKMKMTDNLFKEMGERERTGKKIKEPSKPKRRIKL